MMKEYLTLNPIKYINGKISVPGSKSISNRVLLLAAQSIGNTILHNLPNCNDILYMLYALKKLNIKYKLFNSGKSCIIYGNKGPISNKKTKIFVGCSGTVIRFLTAALCVKNNNVIFFGDLRMKYRPIKDLILALRQGKASIKPTINKKSILHVYGGGYEGGNIFIKGNVSSQFITSLLMMAPQATHNSTIQIIGNLISKSYIDLTISLMKIFGINIKHKNYKVFYISGNQKYQSPGSYYIESDVSSASYFLSAAAIKGGTVRVYGINKNSIQGEMSFLYFLRKMGACIKLGKNYIQCSKKNSIKSVDIDMNNSPDSAMTIAITSLFSKKGITKIRNIASWKFKETNRLKVFFQELSRIGIYVKIGNDFIIIKSAQKPKTPVIINTYNDHRIAMCFSLLTLFKIPVTIINPKCVSKTFPNFFYKLSLISKM